MTLELYQQVMLRRDLPEYRLKQGDIAMLIDRVPHPHGGEDGYILEVFNARGESIAVVTVSISDVSPLPSDAVFSIRSLVET